MCLNFHVLTKVNLVLKTFVSEHSNFVCIIYKYDL